MENIQSREVVQKFNLYPAKIRNKLLFLVQLILQKAAETKEISTLEEALKWGKPAYLMSNDSTIRIDWKKSDPQQ